MIDQVGVCAFLCFCRDINGNPLLGLPIGIFHISSSWPVQYTGSGTVGWNSLGEDGVSDDYGSTFAAKLKFLILPPASELMCSVWLPTITKVQPFQINYTISSGYASGDEAGSFEMDLDFGISGYGEASQAKNKSAYLGLPRCGECFSDLKFKMPGPCCCLLEFEVEIDSWLNVTFKFSSHPPHLQCYNPSHGLTTSS